MKSMRYWLVIFLCLGAALADYVDDEWNNFKIKYNKTYTEAESTEKFEKFKKNLEFIQHQNSIMPFTFKVELNRFADLDYSDLILTGSKEPSISTFIKNLFSSKITDHQAPKFNNSIEAPSAVDWRIRMRTSAIKDQQLGKECDSSYAFAVLGALEAHHTLKTGQILDLSEQEIIDCSELNFGCLGGNYVFTYNYLIESGIALEKDFPFKAAEKDCPKEKPARSAAKVYGYAEASGEEDLKKALDQFGPLSVDVSVPKWTFQFYKFGVYSDVYCPKRENTTEVVLFGYGHDDATNLDYWLIRNSWSSGWGENGYMKLERGDNSCLIAKGFYPLLDESARADNQTADLSQVGIGIIAFIVVAIILCCCGCCLLICCIKWCIGLCCD